MKLSIVIPAYNEAENIGQVVRQIEEALDFDFELIVVNDHSLDATSSIVRGLGRTYANLRLMDNRRPAGFANALRSGFECASGELVMPIMGDLCDDLSTVKRMLEKMEQGNDLVCASRYIKGGARLGGSKVKGFFSWFVGRSLCSMIGLPTHDIGNAFKMYRRKVIESIEIEAKGFEISMEIALKAYFLGFRITEVPTVWKEREKGKSSFKMHRLFPDYSKFYIWAICKKITGGTCRSCQS